MSPSVSPYIPREVVESVPMINGTNVPEHKRCRVDVASCSDNMCRKMGLWVRVGENVEAM
eukprot:8353894-Prorocentrum_lima.AAC.1